MPRKIFYQSCEHLDIFRRDSQGRMFCVLRQRHVVPAESVYRKVSWKRSDFIPEYCAYDCWHKTGKTCVQEGGAK